MDTNGRPGAVSWWLGRGRPLDKYEQPLDLPSYNKAMRKWWASHQPTCRLESEGLESWPLRQMVPSEESWKSMRKGGKNGFLVFVMALYWWRLEARSQDSQEALGEFYSVVDDVLYVFRSVLSLDRHARATDGARSIVTSSSERPPISEGKKSSHLSAEAETRRANNDGVRLTRARAAKH